MLSTILKEHTRKPHLELEKVFINKIKEIGTVEDYANLLMALYGFFYPLENKVSNFIDGNLLPDFAIRRKCVWLRNDIYELTGTNEIQLSEKQLPVINSANKALGALYVMEGSTLGGDVIRKMVQSRITLPAGKGLSFFSSYGADIFKMWENFRNFLNELELNGKEKQEVADAAFDTFTGFKSWLKHD